MAPRWTSYEPGPGGKGYTLYDDKDKPSLFAPTPSLDALLPSLKPRADYLANNGAGGTSGGDPSQTFAGPPAQVADVGPAMSVAPEPVSREAPVQPVNAPAGGGRTRARITPQEQQQGQPEPQGSAFDPTQIPDSPMSPEERRLRLLEDKMVERAKHGSPIVKTEAHWQDKNRQFESRERPAELDELARRQQAASEAQGLLDRSMAEANAKAEQVRQETAEKENELAARKDTAARKHLEDQFKLEGEIEAERKALKNPNDFWEGLGTGNQVGATIAMALGGLGEAIKGGDGSKIAGAFQAAIDRHAQARVRNIGMLDQQRGRNDEAHKVTQQRLEAERAQAIKAADDRIKGILADGANPIVRELVYEDIAVNESSKVLAVKAIQWLRGKMPNINDDTGKTPGIHANMDPKDMERSAEEYLRKAKPAEKALVFETGPNGELVPKQIVRYLAAEAAEKQRQLADARERLGYADKYAASQRLAQEWEKEKITGGGGDPLKLQMQIEKDRIKRRGDVRDQDLKAAGITGPVAASRSKAQMEAAEKAEQRAEKSGARTLVYEGQEYETRPGTSEKEMQDVRDSGASIVTIDKAISILKEEASLKNKFRDNPRVEMASKMLAGISANALLNSGVVNPSELESFNKTASNLGALGPSGLQALGDIRDVTKARLGARLEQMGAKPKGAR